eukprot:9574165-Alexandrium_andersonii.AAC.1
MSDAPEGGCKSQQLTGPAAPRLAPEHQHTAATAWCSVRRAWPRRGAGESAGVGAAPPWATLLVASELALGLQLGAGGRNEQLGVATRGAGNGGRDCRGQQSSTS